MQLTLEQSAGIEGHEVGKTRVTFDSSKIYGWPLALVDSTHRYGNLWF